jgi:hypothetical protein
MTQMTKRINAIATRLWQSDPWLTGASALMLAALGAAFIGLAVDPRVITGMPAWMKPAKFAVSTGVFMLTLAWIFTYLPAWRKTRLMAGRGTAAILVLEVAIIYIQAWRGTTSHFNAATPLDIALFSVMGFSIAVQTALSILVAIALWRQPFADRALGWALRLGLTLSIAGASTGGFMVTPTPAQLAEAHATHRMTVSGAHTVGAPDGGPGLVGVGWSREHGDLRVPHFLGLHAVQFLPLVVAALARRRVPESIRIRMTFAAAASYTALFAILLWQALRGQSVARPDAVTVVALLAWAVATSSASWLLLARRTAVRSHVMA